MRRATCQPKRANSMPGGTSAVALHSGFKAQNMGARGLLHRRVLPRRSAIECDRSARKKDHAGKNVDLSIPNNTNNSCIRTEPGSPLKHLIPALLPPTEVYVNRPFMNS